MRMSPDLDYKVERRDQKDNPKELAAIEVSSTRFAKEELKHIIMKQRITLEKNTRLYKEMR